MTHFQLKSNYPHPERSSDLSQGERLHSTSDFQLPTSDLRLPIATSNLQPPTVIEKLRQKIHRLETASRVDDGQVVPSGCYAIDRMLPEGGYRRGTLIEWITPGSHSGGHGADFISLMTAQKACQDGGALVVFDPDRQFYPPAANALGINNSNLIVLRPPTRLSNHANDDDQNEIYWAIDQALRCSAVAAVWGSLDQLGERWFRRFQLAAESSGTMGLFVRPASALNRPSWAEVQWKVLNANLRLQLHRCRGTLTGKTIDLEINTITGSVCESTRTRSDYEQQPCDPHPLSLQHNRPRPRHCRSTQLPAKTGPLPVAAQLAHPKARRRTKRA